MDFAAFGRTRWMHDAIVQAAAAGHRPVLIRTAAAAPEYGIDEKAFAALAESHGCSFFTDADLGSVARVDQARRSGAAVAISVNWPSVIGSEMRGAFAHGIVNAHAGDLPRYRGNACPNWAILAAEKKAYITLHRMADHIDDGPILLQRAMEIGEQTYVGDIYRFLDESIPSMFVELLDGLVAGTIRERRQPEDPALALRCFPRRESDSEIEWASPAEEIARLVHASAEPFSGAYTWLDGRRVRIWRAHAMGLPYSWHGSPGQVVSCEGGAIDVLCADGVLRVSELEIEGQGRGEAGRFIRSTRARFGLDVSAEIAALRRRLEALESRTERKGA
jgi:UDP-4-amino-4-deoxy-L-arabinose formyltransferase/UDP-glucuronic acid dehydrogenase (UDP-4-keto-hexauronic acid decarboxylating)